MTGAVALNSAQIDFSTLTVDFYSVGKGSAHGFRGDGTGGAMSNPTLEQANGTVSTCIRLEDQGAAIVYASSGLPTDKPSIEDSFRRIIIDDLSLNQADTSSYANNTGYGWTTSDDALSSKDGSTIIIQLRAD